VSDERTKLVQEEDELWKEVSSLVERLTPEQIERPGLIPEGWSVKDLLWHLACWTAESGRQLERIRAGTYEEQDLDTDGMNARFFDESKRMNLSEVRAQFAAARTRALKEWAAIDEITPEAIEWFGESGPIHYREHLPQLRAWVQTLAAGT
jgi:hypothetical protein